MILTAKEVAARWNCSLPLIYKLTASGDLPAFRIGTTKGYRYRIKDIEAFECNSPNTEESTASTGVTPADSRFDGALARTNLMSPDEGLRTSGDWLTPGGTHRG